jgi:hypothetical protein
LSIVRSKKDAVNTQVFNKSDHLHHQQQSTHPEDIAELPNY